VNRVQEDVDAAIRGALGKAVDYVTRVDDGRDCVIVALRRNQGVAFAALEKLSQLFGTKDINFDSGSDGEYGTNPEIMIDGIEWDEPGVTHGKGKAR